MRFIDRALHYANSRWLFPARTNYLNARLAPYLSKSLRILDMGASDGNLADAFQRSGTIVSDATVVGCDAHIQSESKIPMISYDGRRLPFGDATFDCVMLIDVLHHDLSPAHVLAEAKRVSSHRVLIKDHFWRNRLDFFGLKVMDYIGNNPYGIALPYNYFRIDQWEQHMADLQLDILRQETFRYNIIDPCQHIILDVVKPSA